LIRWAYEGVGPGGEPRRGQIEANDRRDVFDRLDREGTTLTAPLLEVTEQFSLSTVRHTLEQLLLRGRIEYARLTCWRIVNNFLRRGIAIEDAFESCAQDCEIAHFAAVLRTIVASIKTGGLEVSEALDEHVEFPKEEVDLIRIAEESNLAFTVVIPRIIEIAETRRKWKGRQLASAIQNYMAYPLLFILLVYLARSFVPTMGNFSRTMADGDVPWYLVATGWVASFLTSPLSMTTAIVVVAVIVLVAPGLMREDSVRSVVEKVRWNTPFIGPLLKYRDLVADRSTGVGLLSAFTFSGVPPERRLELAARGVASPSFRRAIEKQAARVAVQDVGFEASFLEVSFWGTEIRGMIRSTAPTDLVGMFAALKPDYEVQADTAWAVSTEAIQTFNNVFLGLAVLLVSLVVTLAPIAISSAAIAK
jgi:type II secretory pathway component PulF